LEVELREEPFEPVSWFKRLLVGQVLVEMVPAVCPLRGHVDGAASALDINSIAMAVVAISVTSIIFLVLFIFHLSIQTVLRFCAFQSSHDGMLSKWNNRYLNIQMNVNPSKWE
jgi:uncharacterized membrane protein YdbT with pleckstrin-like domain